MTDRPTNQPTERPTNQRQRTDMGAHKEVTTSPEDEVMQGMLRV